MPRPAPQRFATAWSYGGITGSRVAVVMFIALAVLVTLARRGQP